MDELINITEQDGREAVSARELHAFLESKQRFADWIKNRIEKYGLVENEDYVVFHNSMKNPLGGRPLDEYALTLDCAKELSMVEGNEKGKQARRYFIDRDRQLRELEQERIALFSSKRNYRQLRRMAGELVVNEGLTQKKAAQVLSVTEKTMSDWAVANDWRAMRKARERMEDNPIGIERLLDIVGDVCRIKDSELRTSIANKLIK